MPDRTDLARRVEEAVARFNAMPVEQQIAMHRAQRESWVRAMAPCEHGVADFEECARCREPFRTESTGDE